MQPRSPSRAVISSLVSPAMAAAKGAGSSAQAACRSAGSACDLPSSARPRASVAVSQYLASLIIISMTK